MFAMGSIAFGQQLKSTPISKQTSITDLPDMEAEFPGGQEALYAWMGENISYPEAAKADKAEGKVFVRFTVDKTGVVKDVKVFKSTHEAFDKAVLSAMAKMPNWKPAESNGVKVSQLFTLPFNFTL